MQILFHKTAVDERTGPFELSKFFSSYFTIMPNTFKVSSVTIEKFVTERLQLGSSPDLPAGHYLNDCFEYNSEKCGTILGESEWNPEISVPAQNGFVSAVLSAYNHHHKLTLRPDDVWIAITTQFSAYVNGNAENLRGLFVSHKDKKEINVTLGRPKYSQFAYLMSQEIKKHIKDPAVIDWILPKFSTTTSTDTVVGSVIAMATLKKYFLHIFTSMCGIPEVTLLGTPDDWKSIHEKVQFLRRFGPRCNAWVDLLVPVTANFYQSSIGYVDIDYWKRVVSQRHANGSGSDTLSGWITAFCVFDDKGKWQLTDGGVIHSKAVPIGYATAPVVLVAPDNSRSNGLMFAGHMAVKSTDGVTVSPHASWVIVQSEGSGEDKPVKNLY